MKICFFTGDITRSGGTERVVSTLTEGLLYGNTKDQFYILSLEMKESTPFFHFDKKIILAHLDVSEELSPVEKLFKVVRGLRKYVVENRIDILIDVDTLLSVYSTPALIFTETKHIAWEHFTLHHDLGVRYRNWGRKLAGRFADALVVLTQRDQQQFVAQDWIKRPVKHIYNPIYLNGHMIIETTSDSKILLSAGRLTAQKGFDLLIDVAEIIFKKHPDWQWIVVGDGEDRKMLEEKIKEKHLEHHVLLPGVVDNIEDYYLRAAIFVLTSRFEPFGLVLTEAKSFYLPCVSFDVDSGPGEIILNEVNGYLIEPFDIAEMAEKINILIENPEIRQQYAANAMQDTEKFHLEVIKGKWEKLFENIE